ncbi:MAG: LacI family DNA-binding transcriptional regulator [Chloroflexi bacterium]|nr:LacI family DNA-binding transcriptional regulator [Chloroflexota bacterium]
MGLASGDNQPIHRRVRLSDVARAAGVSKTVASRGLAGYPDAAPATRERVRRVARELGYRASVRARLLSAGKDAPARCAVVSLGLTTAQIGRSFFGPVLAGVMARAAQEGIDVQLIALPDTGNGIAGALDRLVAEDRADGFILVTWLPLTPEDVAPLEQSGLPFVLANRHFDAYPGHPVNCVTLGWEQATCDAVVRLAALGRRTMAMVLPWRETSTARDHERGWHQGVAHTGIAAVDAPVLRMTLKPEDAASQEWARRLLTAGLPGTSQVPTALVGFNDWYALTGLRAATAAGVPVPDQLSVIGFDNAIGPATTPPLCSYDPHPHDLGMAAAELLGAALRRELESPRRVTIPLDFVCRESCGPAPRR